MESWLEDGEEINFPGYVVYNKYRKNRTGGGITFILRSEIAFAEINVDLPGESFEFAGLCFY